MDGKLQEEYEDRLQKALEELREVYDKQMQQNRDDFAKLYDDRVRPHSRRHFLTVFVGDEISLSLRR